MGKGGLGNMKSNTASRSRRATRLTGRKRKELARRIWSDKPGLDVVHRDAAGIDIGSREHYGAVGPDRDAEPVRVFGCFTTDLRRMAVWMMRCGIKRVAMQSRECTGFRCTTYESSVAVR